MSDASQGLRLYNTLTRTKEDFVPIDPLNVRMYVCGPTVYDFAHIGNARPVIVFDVLFRLLRQVYGEAHVTYVRNITDVDDKINARALRDFGGEIASGTLSLNEAIRRVTEKTADQFHSDVAVLGCLEPTVEPRATEFVEPRADGKVDMITLIQSLIERGHAYVAAGEVLFDTASMPDYGQLSKRNLDEQQAGARVAVDAHKKNPGDFVLWKLSSPEEPGWNSPWGRGRPGWHIECSAMSAAYLGEVFDIHGGGLDLIFPHHENEIAQSRCAHGTDVMANIWMHNGFLQVEGQKMSKSVGNFYSINELLETETFGGRKWPGEVLRLAMLMTHYREPIDFSVRKLEEAENTLRKWKRVADGARYETGPPSSFVKALSDDLSTPQAFYILAELVSDASKGLGSEGSETPFVEIDGDPIDVEFKLNAAAEVKAALLFLGFDFAEAKVAEHAIVEAIETRLALIASKNWAEADRIRDELLAQGVQLKDGKDLVTGERVTTWEVKR
ncbi:MULTISPECIES: cysteine--tRNA ligase [unclassified Mesorhizobium]|uniref:cysteine--tRNA ligase n=1 Tax=unclassified Mesorhizobium TaxID=325217 RepID=UPI0003CFF1ED|nr:cysteine--tRNA ligase [Mesorhizobium sp. L2C084A000]ESZ24206.1 cysteinyl-tRNA synthetase [Mesorhizobium sp. L2C084A000]